jgi:hypothetical protein
MEEELPKEKQEWLIELLPMDGLTFEPRVIIAAKVRKVRHANRYKGDIRATINALLGYRRILRQGAAMRFSVERAP